MSELTIHVTHEWRPGHADPLAQLNERISKIMSDLETITGALTAAQGDLDQIKAFLSTQNEQLATLTARLTQLDQTTPPQVDLSSALALATHIKDEADQIVAGFTPAVAASADPTSSSVTDASSGTASSPSSSSDTSGSPAADETGAAASGDVVADPTVGTSDTSGVPTDQSSDTSTAPADGSTGATDVSVDAGTDVGNASDATVSSGGSVPDTDTANNE